MSYEEFYLLAIPEEEEIDVEIVTLTDEELERILRDELEKNGVDRIVKIVRRVRERLVKEGYAVSEDRIRKILRDLMGLEYFKYNY